jgi:hypothetical protein
VATDVTGATCTIEAQATWHAAFSSRVLYCWVQARTGPEDCRETVRKLKSRGMTPTEISEITGLPEDEIQAL